MALEQFHHECNTDQQPYITYPHTDVHNNTTWLVAKEIPIWKRQKETNSATDTYTTDAAADDDNDDDNNDEAINK